MLEEEIKGRMREQGEEEVNVRISRMEEKGLDKGKVQVRKCRTVLKEKKRVIKKVR